MTRPEATREAQRIAAALGQNSEAIHTGEIPWETFSERNGALWREAERVPLVHALVTALLRHDPHWREEPSR